MEIRRYVQYDVRENFYLCSDVFSHIGFTRKK